MPKRCDLTGMRFGRLEVVFRLPGKLWGGTPWMCRCACGNWSYTTAASLRGGNTASCGCAGRAKTSERNYRHGQSKTPEYAVLNGMKTRCYNETRPEYPNYGGRGIRVCDRWRFGEGGKTGFECFLADVGPRPTPLHSIERIDNDGHYEPGNVIWATLSHQALNKRRNRFMVVNGEKVLAARVAEQNGLRAETFRNRVRRLGWSIEEAATTPVVPNAARRYGD